MSDETQTQTTPTGELEAAHARIAALEQELEAAKRVELITPEAQRERWGRNSSKGLESA